MGGIDTVLRAVEAFGEFLTDVDPLPLALALCCHVLKLACTSRAWRNVIAAAYPASLVPYPRILAAYVAGVGVNAILPVRGGDVVRLAIAHRAVPGSSYTTLASTYVVMAIADVTFALCVFAYALSVGALPGLDVVPGLPSFDFAWLFRHETAAEVGIALLAIVALGAAIWAYEQLPRFRRRVGQAFAVLRTPRRYLRTVGAWQAADWGLRMLTIWFFLGAFGLEQSVQAVLLVQATQSLATLLPISPGGVGTEQAFLAYAFRGTAPQTQVLAFSVGMRIALTVVNVLLALVALFATLGTVRIRHAVDRAARQREQSEDEAGGGSET